MNHQNSTAPEIASAFPGRSAKSIRLMMAGNVIRVGRDGSLLSMGGTDEVRELVEEAPSNDGPVSHQANQDRRSKKRITADKLWSDHMLGDDTWAEGGELDGQPVAYRWNGVSYEFVSDVHGTTLAASWFNENHPEHASISKASSSWQFFTSMLRTERRIPKLTTRVVIPCQDRYLEIKPDGQVVALAPDRALGLTHQIKINCQTAADQTHEVTPPPPTSRFLKWIEAAHPDPDVRALVQEQCGATLLPTNFQVAAWWYGKAGCGKSTLAEICKAMQHNAASTRLNALGSRFGGQSLVGASLIMVDEVDADGRTDEGLLKSWISGNSVTVDRKNVAPITYQSRAKWLICSNMAPFFKDKSDGIWRRICVVPWEVVVPEEDRIPDFQNVVLAEEGVHILNWMLAGAVRLVQRGTFLPESQRPEIVRDVKLEARYDCDSVLAWTADENVVVTNPVGGSYNSKDLVYGAYEDWCRAAHRDALERRQFWKGLKGLLKFRETRPREAGRNLTRRVNLAWDGPVNSVGGTVVDINAGRAKVPDVGPGASTADPFDQLLSGKDIEF